MSVLPIGIGSSIGYNIDNSVRLRAAASAYFSRQFGAPTDNKKWTLSQWIKRGALSLADDQHLFMVSDVDVGTNPTNYSRLLLTTSGTLSLQSSGSASEAFTSSALYRDPIAHMHVMLVMDCANTSVKCYVNGTEISYASRTNPTNTNPLGNKSGNYHRFGLFRTAEPRPFDGLLSDVHFIDGQALTPSSFGETNADGVWVPKPYSGTYGASGFKLDFKDAAVTAGSNAGLGKDVSGNGNYWTTNNISVTAGVTYDSMVDTPTNNYATLNPTDPVLGGTTYATSGANLDLTTAGTYAARATIFPPSGKYWAEYTMTSSATANGTVLGVGKADANIASGTGTYTAYRMNGNKEVNGTGSAYGATFTNTDVIGLAWDVGAGTIEFYKQTSGSGAFTSQGQLTGLSTAGDLAFLCRTANSGSWNFGQRPFNNSSIPSGYNRLCTANLPAVAIAKPASHFDAKTRVGTAATYSVTGLGFAPGLVWPKSRGRALDHALYDYVRGVEKRLESNNTDAEVTGDTTGLTAFNSDGYTGGALDQINGTTATNSFIDWMWKAGGAPTTDNVAGAGNTPTAGSVKIDGANLGSALAGTIAATRLSANTTAGFSIVTWTGTGTAGTVAHGLGVTPKMIMVSARDATGNDRPVWHTGLTGASYYTYINSTAAQDNTNAIFGTSAPDSSVFSIRTSTNVNQNTKLYVAYCFAEIPGYSKFGSYTGNGSSDGPFVHCGFRPRYLMVKMNSGADSWQIHDTAREPYNMGTARLHANTAAAEDASGTMDIVSNGFKPRGNDSAINSTGATYIFMTFAEHPFGGSNVAPAPAR